MRIFTTSIILLSFFLLVTVDCHAARVKAYVNRFNVTTGDNRDDFKTALQTLIMSRLNSDEIQAVDNQAEAEFQITGSYIVFGAVFSIDALVKSSSGAFVDRVFIQGESQDDLINSASLLAKQLRRAILKGSPGFADKSGADPVPAASDKKSLLPLKKDKPNRSKPLTPSVNQQAFPANIDNAPSSPSVANPLPSSPKSETPAILWESHRLSEPLHNFAIGRVSGDKGVELFTIGDQYLRLYLKGKNLQFLNAVSIDPDERLVSVDVADLDHDSRTEVYLSVLKNGQPRSKVFTVENSILKKLADDIPYLLKGIELEGGARKIYAQKVGIDGILTGDIYELVKNGFDYKVQNGFKLPPLANIYNFNRFFDAKGKMNFVVLHPDGYLLVYSSDLKLLWKSRDKFGGSELPFCTVSSGKSSESCRDTVPRRILVSKSGEILVPRNTGLVISGNSRGYTASSLVRFVWNGSAMVEKSRLPQSKSYLADYLLLEKGGELLLLEVEPFVPGQEERGSRLVTKKI